MRKIENSGNTTLIFNTDFVNAEEKATALNELSEFKTKKDLNKLMRAMEAGTV